MASIAKPTSLDGAILRGINMPSTFWSPAHAASWEATYEDGFVLREREGARYRQIDRSRLARFSLVMPGEVLFETWPQDGTAGLRLVYRRRTRITPGVGGQVGFLVGWVPDLLWWIDPARREYRESPGFDRHDPDFSPVPPIEAEGEHWGSLLDDLHTGP